MTAPNRRPRLHASPRVGALHAVLGVALAVLTPAACSGPSQPADVATPTTSSTPSAGSTTTGRATAGLVVRDAWVKAADSGMTAVFATLVNDSDHDVHIVGATSTAAAMVELHETVPDGTGGTVMRQVPQGFVVPAGGTRTLDPGGDHIMLMDLTAPVLPGTEVTVALRTEDGGTLPLIAVARSYAGAQEHYTGPTP